MAKPLIKRLRNDVAYLLVAFLVVCAKRVPRKIGLRIFGVVGRLVYLFPSKDKQRTIEHLTQHYAGTWSQKKILQTAQNVYYNAGKNLFDAMYLSSCSDKEFARIVTHDDMTPMDNAYKQGNGVIVVTGHCGCYEMNVQVGARRGYACVTIGQKLFDPRIDVLITRMRKRNDVIYLHRDKSSREVVRLLKNGRLLGVLVDQDTYGDGVFAHFLGRLAYTPSGPVRMAMRLGIPLFVGNSARQSDDTHHFYVSGPLQLEDTGDFERDLVFNVERVNTILSKEVLQFPEQWVWMHRRWRRRPDDEKYRDVPNIERYHTT